MVLKGRKMASNWVRLEIIGDRSNFFLYLQRKSISCMKFKFSIHFLIGCFNP